MNERIRDSFRHRTELERRVLDLIVADGIITRAALYDHFVVALGMPAEKVHEAVNGLCSSHVIQFWNRTPREVIEWVKKHPLRRPILEHNNDPYRDKNLFTSRTAFMFYTPGDAVEHVFYGRWFVGKLLEMATEKRDELTRRW